MSNQFIVRANVPILDEHELFDDDGKLIATIDEEKLRRIVENNNRRVEETGDEVPIVIGHTDDYSPEEKQPEIVGYARDFVLKPLFKTGRKAIYATFRFFKDKAQVIRQFPRRSVELWLKKMEIDPISLLGASAPERSLGLLRYSSEGLRYSRTIEENSVDNAKQIVDQVLAAIQETDVWQFMSQLMEEAKSEGVSGESPMDDGSQDQDVSVDQEPTDELPAPEDDEDDVNKPVQYNQGTPMKKYSAPSGTNTFVPSGDKDQVRLQRDQARIRLSRVEMENERLKKEVDKLRLKFRRSEREKTLIQLDAEGVQFDLAEELEDSMNLTDESFDKRVDRIRKRYQRAPVGESDALRHSRIHNPAPAGQKMTKGRMEEIVRYARKKGIDFEDALAELNGQVGKNGKEVEQVF